MKAGRVPIGEPSNKTVAYRENGKTYLHRLDGTSQEVPYDSISYASGDCWIIWKNRLQGIYREGKGELIPPVYQHLSPANTSADCWAFSVQKYAMSSIVNDRNQAILPWRAAKYGNLELLGDTILEYKARESSYVSRFGNPVADQTARLHQPPEIKRVASDRYVLCYLRKAALRCDTFREAEGFAHGAAPVRLDSLWGYIGLDGAWLIKPRFQAARPFDAAGHAVVKDKGQYGLIRRDGSVLLAPKFSFLKPLSETLFEFKEADRTGLVDTNGAIVLPAGLYAGISKVGVDAFYVRRADSISIFRLDGKQLPVDSVFQCEADLFGGSLAISRNYYEGGKRPKVVTKGAMDLSGNWLIPPAFHGAFTQRRHFFLVEAKILAGHKISELALERSDPGKYLLYNRQGKLLLPYLVSAFPDVRDEPYAVIKLNEKFGLVTPLGIELAPEYEQLTRKSNGWIYAKQGAKWGAMHSESQD